MDTGHAFEVVTVRVVGMCRGREIDAQAVASLDADDLMLAWPARDPWRLPLQDLEGVHVGAASLTLYLREHDVLELTGTDALRGFARVLTDRACRLPEFTRGLRMLGSVRAADGRRAPVRADGDGPLRRAHDRWFAPLLEARRTVHGVSDPQRQVALLPGATLRDDMLRAAADIARMVAPHDAAEQRAVEAAIEDEAAPLFVALAHLALAADAVQGGASDTRFADWRRWVETVRRAYAEADDAWSGIAEIVGVE
jgi:hypothetical protein